MILNEKFGILTRIILYKEKIVSLLKSNQAQSDCFMYTYKISLYSHYIDDGAKNDRKIHLYKLESM